MLTDSVHNEMKGEHKRQINNKKNIMEVRMILYLKNQK